MKPLNLDELFIIAEATPVLEQVEAALRQSGSAETADRLNKLMQDTGVKIDREMRGFEENELAPGPQTAALNAAYEPVNSGRLSVLLDAAALLAGHDALESLNGVMQSLPVPVSSSNTDSPSAPPTPSA